MFSPGCGHCKKMKPEYDEAAEILNKGADVSAHFLRSVKRNDHRMRLGRSRSTCPAKRTCLMFSLMWKREEIASSCSRAHNVHLMTLIKVSNSKFEI